VPESSEALVSSELSRLISASFNFRFLVFPLLLTDSLTVDPLGGHFEFLLLEVTMATFLVVVMSWM
jgi:hypothetical protein